MATQFNAVYRNSHLSNNNRRTNAQVVLNPAQHPGPTVTISVKPIMRTETTEITVPGHFTLAQFHLLVNQILTDGMAWGGIPRPLYGYEFDLVMAGQPNMAYNRRIYVEDIDRWENHVAAEFALELSPLSQMPMSEFENNVFYLRFIHPDQAFDENTALNMSAILAANNDTSDFVIYNDNDDEPIMAPLSMDDLMVEPNSV